MIDRTNFYDTIKPLFGKLTQSQVNGLNAILDEWEKNSGDADTRQLAYILATIFHETGKTMQPIKERGSRAYLTSKPYYPYFGRGFVQLTWVNNYRKFGKSLNIDLVNIPDLALKLNNAVYITFEGMNKGLFTGKKLSDYFNDIKEDAIWARSIINGKRKGELLPDCAELIAGYYEQFKKALIIDVQPGGAA